jgi:hypothetical protein
MLSSAPPFTFVAFGVRDERLIAGSAPPSDVIDANRIFSDGVHVGITGRADPTARELKSICRPARCDRNVDRKSVNN